MVSLPSHFFRFLLDEIEVLAQKDVVFGQLVTFNNVGDAEHPFRVFWRTRDIEVKSYIDNFFVTLQNPSLLPIEPENNTFALSNGVLSYHCFFADADITRLAESDPEILERSLKNLPADENVIASVAPAEFYRDPHKTTHLIQNFVNHFYSKNSAFKSCVFRTIKFDKPAPLHAGVFIFFNTATRDIDFKARLEINRRLKLFLYDEAKYSLLPPIMKERDIMAVKAAISQLYARTDSHDLGHVLDAFKSLEDFAFDETNGQYVYGAHKQDNNMLKDLLRKHILSNDKEPSIVVYPNLIGYFNHYLKVRMDFRADVATTDPNSLTTLSFYEDIFIPFSNNLIFNNRISGIADQTLRYKFNCSKRRVDVAIPNDILGCHAMYIIWSNVIRNTVKHAELTDDEKANLEFTVDISEFKNNYDYYEISLWSNVFREKQVIDKLVLNRNRSLDDTILNGETNKLRDNALGTIEMDTCAAYLRKLPVTEVENEKYNLFEGARVKDSKAHKEVDGSLTPIIMYAYAHRSEKEKRVISKYSVGYRFYLLKPKEVLVVSDTPDQLSKTLVKNMTRLDLYKAGIEFIKKSDLGSKTFDHSFLLFQGSRHEFIQLLSNSYAIQGTLPKRQLFFGDFEQVDDAKHFIKCCWKEWLRLFDRSITIFNNSTSKKIFDSDMTGNLVEVVLYNHDTSLSSASEEGTVNTLMNGKYHEMMCGHHWTKKNLGDYLTQDGLRACRHFDSYLESVFTKVIIIDERIQKTVVANDKRYGSIPFSVYFRQMGVLIPEGLRESEPDLNSSNLSGEKEKIENFINAHIANSSFLVLHLGIVEKLLNDKIEEKNEAVIEAAIISLIPNEENRRKVVITSGRGRPNNLSPGYSFVPVSLLQNAIETTFDKYRLVQILYNSRKPL